MYENCFIKVMNDEKSRNNKTKLPNPSGMEQNVAKNEYK